MENIEEQNPEQIQTDSEEPAVETLENSLPDSESESLPLLRNQPAPRDSSLDCFRGLIMIWESLDHAREIMSNIKIEHEQWYSVPTYQHATLSRLQVWSLRLPTSFCAPGFMFLMGLGMSLFADSRSRQGWSTWQIQKHFIIRGSVLVILNTIHFPPIWFFMGFVPMLTVLYALGVDMILGAFIMEVSRKLQKFAENRFGMGQNIVVGFYALVALFLVVFSTLFVDGMQLPTAETKYSAWLLYTVLPYIYSDGSFLSIYPFLPWLALVAWGLLFGHLYSNPKFDNQRKMALHAGTGLSFLFGFVILRWLGGFGNVHMELLKPSADQDFVSFFTLIKYPPSLTYVLWTMGVNHLLILLMMIIQEVSNLSPLIVFGRSALFFYIMHFWVYAGFGVIQYCIGWEKVNLGPFILLWVLGLIVLYPMCYYYGRFKSSKPLDSLWRLL
jgi:uncharacterized membrane protein